jgi:hypothetical protein
LKVKTPSVWILAYGQFLYDIYAKDDSLSREKHTHIDRRDLIVWFAGCPQGWERGHET